MSLAGTSLANGLRAVVRSVPLGAHSRTPDGVAVRWRGRLHPAGLCVSDRSVSAVGSYCESGRLCHRAEGMWTEKCSDAHGVRELALGCPPRGSQPAGGCGNRAPQRTPGWEASLSTKELTTRSCRTEALVPHTEGSPASLVTRRQPPLAPRGLGMEVTWGLAAFL